MKYITKTLLILAALAIIVLLVLVFTGIFRSRGPELPPGQEYVAARGEGALVEGFPEEIILEDDITIEESYGINYTEDNVHQFVARYTSERNVGELALMYYHYFDENRWEILTGPDPDLGTLTYYYARRKDGDLNVTFEPRGGMTKVVITRTVER